MGKDSSFKKANLSNVVNKDGSIFRNQGTVICHNSFHMLSHMYSCHHESYLHVMLSIVLKMLNDSSQTSIRCQCNWNCKLVGM